MPTPKNISVQQGLVAVLTFLIGFGHLIGGVAVGIGSLDLLYQSRGADLHGPDAFCGAIASTMAFAGLFVSILSFLIGIGCMWAGSSLHRRSEGGRVFVLVYSGLLGLIGLQMLFSTAIGALTGGISTPDVLPLAVTAGIASLQIAYAGLCFVALRIGASRFPE